MADRLPTSKVLKDAWKIVKDRAASATDPTERIKWERRRAILDEELSRFELLTEGNSLPKRVFVSYSKSSGQVYFSYLKRLLTEKGFDVVTGFDDPPGTESNILKMVLKQLMRSSFYIAILSKEIQVVEGENKRWSPGVWISEEKGMALALEKPFLLLVHREVHEDFFKKTTPEKLHIFFTEENFEEMAQKIADRANDRYGEFLRRAATVIGG